MTRKQQIDKDIKDLRERYGQDFSDEMVERLSALLDDYWFLGYRAAQEEA